MNKLELYINGKQIDIDSNINIPFNFRFEDLQNPTVIKNSFTKTVSVLASHNNNRVFNHIYILGQQIIDFNPRLRNPFVLTSGGTVVETGFCEMNSIDFKGPYPSYYNLTLYGGLSDFFYSLSEKYLENLVDNEAFADNFKHFITADRVQHSWTESDYYKYILSYSGQYNNFENDKRFTSIEAAGTFKWVEPSGSTFVAVGDKVRGIAEDNGYNYISSETNFNFNKIRKYDSIGFWYGVGPNNTLAYTSEDDATGWISNNIPASYGDVEVRDSAATILADVGGSPLWRRSLFATDKGLFHYYSSEGPGNPIGTTASQYVEYPITSVEHMLNANSGAIFCAITGSTIERVILSQPPGGTPDIDAYARINGNIVRNFSGKVLIPGKRGIIYITDTSEVRNMIAPRELNTGFTQNNYVDIAYMEDVNRYIVIADNGNYVILSNSSTPTVISTGTISDDFYYSVAYNNGIVSAVGLNVTAASSDNGFTWTVISSQITTEPIPDAEEHQRNEFRSYYQRPCIRLKHLFTEICNQSGYEVVLDPAFFNVNNPYWEKTWLMMDRLTVHQSDLDDTKHGNIRTGDQVTFDLMVKNGISQKDFIINFCKLFGLQLEKDKVNNKISIWDRNTFFSQYKIEDWTYKIDYNQNSTIDPLVFKYKYAELKYKDSGTQYETDYQEKYNRSYGRKQIDTGYGFNSNTKNLVENQIFQNITISQDYDLYFADRGGSGFAYRDDKILPAAYTKKNNVRENTNVSMVLLFDAGMQDLRETARITDDTFDMETTGLYSWNESEGIDVNSIPLMTRTMTFKNDVYSLDFAKPEEIYYHIEDQATEYPDTATIYARYWEKFLSERLSENTRVYTAYFYLSLSDINQFRFNRFVTIKNTLWHVNRILDYDMTKDVSTKVELVRVRDIGNYTDLY